MLGLSSQPGPLKQWPGPLISPQRQPIAYRAPVPSGLIESIGHSVQQQDVFGIRSNQQQQVYLPPPSSEIPPPPHGLETLPLAPPAPFHGQSTLQLQDFSPRVVQQPCGHGPDLPRLQSSYGVPNQGPLDVGPSGFEIAQNSVQSNLLTSYGPPASGSALGGDFTNIVSEAHEPSSSYGPPPSGNPADSLAFGSQKSSSTVEISKSGDEEHGDAQANELPGLSGAGLDIISAKKSQTVEIPVEGQLGSYTLQFQSADPLAPRANPADTPDHQKLLSEGLLQSILTAIEQPKKPNQPIVVSDESLQNHPDVQQFVHSPAGQETLAEPKTE